MKDFFNTKGFLKKIMTDCFFLKKIWNDVFSEMEGYICC